MMSSTKIICNILLVLSLVYETTCIHCFYCNSANNSACIDFDTLEDDMRARIIPAVHCETAIPSPVAYNFFCRKIVQTIFHPHHDSEVRVTRGCGWVRHHSECYRADNQDHQETVCQCFSDYCNSSDKVDPAGITAIFLIFSAVLYFYR